MRRTYRAKKDTGGALDHKDVIQALDEKTSAFDAFYIQNIKQTKKELSCVASGHYGTAANKIRKRKYVKRIVKDPEPSTGLSPSQSVFLTPDKSMRVNKVQDLFDQLLNLTSSPRNNQSNFERVQRLQRDGKKYNRKKLAKIKKLNCSSSDSLDSDKENSNVHCEDVQNVTDLRSYELLVERDKKPSPKYLDESINNIVRNISVLKNINHRNSLSDSTDKPNNYARNRLTTNLQSPSNSPLCSTPFKEKYRSQSIFKLSPIAFGKGDVSPNYATIVEENVCDDENVVMHDKKQGSFRISLCDNPPSPVIHLSINKSTKSGKASKKSDSTNSEADSDQPTDHTKYDSISKVKISNLEVSNLEVSDGQITKAEPFLGFSNIELPKFVGKSLDIENKDKSNETHFKTISEKNKTVDNASEDIFEDSRSENDTCDEIQVLHHNNTSEILDIENENESSYGTCNSADSSQYDEMDKVEAIRVPVIKIKKLSDSILQSYMNQMKTFETHEETESDNYSEVDSDSYASFNESHSSGNSLDKSVVIESQSDITDDKGLLENSHVSSMNNPIEKSDVIESQSDITDDNGLLENSHVSSMNDPIDKSDVIEFLNDITDDKDILENSIISSNNDPSVNGSEEEQCISFVTTRRRNEITNDSLMSDFNNSFGSASSTDCDKTVLSNKVVKSNTSLCLDLESTVAVIDSTKYDHEEVINKDSADKSTNSDGARVALVTKRKTFKLSRESSREMSSSKDSNVIDSEGKSGIVLQPGKKWERSLSIYRRMTMMADHFDHSMLDDDQLHTKGRKYRQSVLNTMELQDTGSLHNESINSRRSTFVSKPCRSTIRIIKEPNSSRLNLSTASVTSDLLGFLNEDCDDTIIELSKLSIADSDHEVTVIENFHDTSNRVSTARDYVLRRCNQTDAILFDECYPDEVLKNCRKIGEGVYGEVFLWRARDGRARVMKIVPIAGTTKVNGEHQKDFQEIISEIVIAMELSALRAHTDELQRHFDEGENVDALDLHSIENATDVYNEVLAVKCVYGAYPSRLLDLWDLYDETKGSENDNPAVLPVDQQYIVLELANAGQDLEGYEFNNAEQAYSLFYQVAYGLAVGEEAFQFEHRDLHWGNVLIAPTDQKFATFVIRGRAHRVPRRGVSATIIDYSLSRLSLPLAGSAAALYNDLAADEGLFDARGDYQFHVYRLMRDKLGNDWKNFDPYTNILWLHYTVDKMITALRYKRTNTKIHKHYIAKLKGIKNRILDYGSAAQFVLTDNEF